MKQRSPIAVALLPLVTFLIYGIVWSVKTKNEMNKLGNNIPTAWLLIVPFVSYYWLWKYCEGVEKVTNGKMSTVMAFVLLFLLGFIGMAIVQNEFNQVSAVGAPAGDSQPQPDNSFGGPAPVTPTSTAAPVVTPDAGTQLPPSTPTPPTVATVEPTQPPQQQV